MLPWVQSVREIERNRIYQYIVEVVRPSFYNSSPQDCANYILKAFRFLTEFVKDV
ncbi:MAG: hypothetical protein ACKPGB_32355 [Dolichospermum sp.]